MPSIRVSSSAPAPATRDDDDARHKSPGEASKASPPRVHPELLTAIHSYLLYLSPNDDSTGADAARRRNFRTAAYALERAYPQDYRRSVEAAVDAASSSSASSSDGGGAHFIELLRRFVQFPRLAEEAARQKREVPIRRHRAGAAQAQLEVASSSTASSSDADVRESPPTKNAGEEASSPPNCPSSATKEERVARLKKEAALAALEVSLPTREAVMSGLDTALAVAMNLRKMKERDRGSKRTDSGAASAAAASASPDDSPVDLDSKRSDSLNGNNEGATNGTNDLTVTPYVAVDDDFVLNRVSHVVHELAVVLGARNVGDSIRTHSRFGSTGTVFIKFTMPADKDGRVRKGRATSPCAGPCASSRRQKLDLLSKCVSHIYGPTVSMRDILEAIDGAKKMGERKDAAALARMRGNGYSQWKERYDQLKVYKDLTGTAKPRFLTKDDPPDSLIRHLSSWVRKQRAQYRLQQRYAEKGDTMELTKGDKSCLQPSSKRYLTEHRIALLNELGMEWEVAEISEELRCKAVTQRGRLCVQAAVNNSNYCTIHLDYGTNQPKVKKQKMHDARDIHETEEHRGAEA